MVQSLVGNLTGCEHLWLDEMYGASLVPPLLVALKATCGTSAPLQSLDLEGSSLEDQGASALAPILAACPSLEQFYAATNRIGDVGARDLADALFTPAHRSCRLLDLSGNAIGDFGADGLARLLTPVPPTGPVPLRELRLNFNHIGASGARLLAQGLRDNVMLETLMLSSNAVGDAGVAALAEALYVRHAGRDSALRRLYLRGVNVTDEGASALLHALRMPMAPPLEILVLDDNPGISPALLDAFEALTAQHRSRAAPPGERATGVFVATR